jgi:Putative restriction endonuclease
MSAQPALEHVHVHDDAEADLVGTDWHQRAIVSLFVAMLDAAAGSGPTWHIGNQLPLRARLASGKRWSPSPDIMVHPHAGPEPRKDMTVERDGTPALVIEVASETTWAYDVDDHAGKPAGYRAIGVQEYLLFDPTGAYLGAACRGWRFGRDGAEEWAPGPDGRYISEALGISFRPEGVFLRVFDTHGRPVATLEERIHEVATLRAELEAMRVQARSGESEPDLTQPTQ